MKESLIVVACFLPLIVIFLVMKLSLWMSAVNQESTYIKNDAKRPHGPYVGNPYEDVDEEEEHY